MLCVGVLTAGLFYGGLWVHAAGDQSAPLYSAAQAKRGADLYQAKQCAMCHGAKLEGNGPVPALSGDNFVSVYSSQPLSALYDKVQGQMPPTNPGSLTPAEASDLIAYLLSSNKYPAGDTELPADRDKLKAIQATKPSN
jgi:mono/diheme cytochrome c family protein